MHKGKPSGWRLISLSSPLLRVLGLLLADGGMGEDFLPCRTGTLKKTSITRKRKVAKPTRRNQNDWNVQGYERPINKNLGPIAYCQKRIFGPKFGFSGPNLDFWDQKTYTSLSKPCSSQDQAMLSKGKSTVLPNNQRGITILGVFI